MQEVVNREEKLNELGERVQKLSPIERAQFDALVSSFIRQAPKQVKLMNHQKKTFRVKKRNQQKLSRKKNRGK